MIIAISPDEQLENMTIFRQAESDSLGVEAIGIPGEKGHVYEMSIPIGYVEERQGPGLETDSRQHRHRRFRRPGGSARAAVVAAGLARRGELRRLRYV